MDLTTFNAPLSARRWGDEFNKMLTRRPAFADQEANVINSDWTPAVDVKEEDKRFLITADVPGVDPADVDVTMHNGMLIIKGERNEETKEENDGFHRVERASGSFYRRFMMPDSADPDKIEAHAKNGVLEIAIRKTEKMHAKKIKVQS